jgi:branched-chain amino acid transport system ATP-binding protein
MLSVTELHAWYDNRRDDGSAGGRNASHILRGIDLSVAQGEIVALLGRNGAGRSTTVKALMGLVRRTGSVRFRDQEIGALRTHQIARAGLGYVPEERDVFPGLSVRQNLELGRQRRNNGPGARWTFEDMYRLFPLLRERANTPAGVLSGGEQQMLALCRTLMGNPGLIMIDEPTEGLAPAMVTLVADLLREVARRGLAVLLIEQKLDIALEICDRLYVMGRGAIVFEGTAADLHAATALRRDWLEV